MNKVEALSAALQGQRVRSVAWNAGEYIEYDGNGFCDEHGFAAHLDDFRDVEWELFGVEPTTVNLEFDAPTEPIVLPFGHGILSIARGTTPDGAFFLVGVEFADTLGEVGRAAVIGAGGFRPTVELSFPTEEQRDRVFRAFCPVEEQPEERAFAYFVKGPNGSTLAFPNDVVDVVDTYCAVYGGNPSDYTSTALVPMMGDIARGLNIPVEQAQSDLDNAPNYAGPKLHAKPFPDKPDSDAAFKKWYWDHGHDWNASHVRPVWIAAQHAMYEALKEQMS